MKDRITIFLYLIGAFFISIACIAQSESKHEKWEYVLEGTGDVLQLALPVAAGITTIVLKDWEGSKQFAFSYASSIVVTHALKKIVRKERPEDRNRFDAFPSGHTTSAFSGASFIQRRYGWKYGGPAYFLAAIVGVSRMEGPDGWHDIWDVAAGAAVGIGATYIFTTPYLKDKVEIGFASNNGNYRIGFKYKF